ATSFHVEELLIGYEEHTFQFTGFPLTNLVTLYHTFPLGAPPDSHFADITWEYRYFMRWFYAPWPAAAVFDIPSTGWVFETSRTPMRMLPLNHEIMQPGDAPIYYIRLAPGSELCLYSHGLQHLYQIMAEVHHNQHAMILRTTTDMMNMPEMLGDQPIVRINYGRHITRADYLQARPVAVINYEFARYNRLSVGDQIALSIPQTQYFDRLFSRTVTVGIAFEDLDAGDEAELGFYMEIVVTSQPEAEPEFVYFEIIGTYQYLILNMGTRQALPIYIPDSALPEGFAILLPENPAPSIASWEYGHIPDSWVSFALADSRAEQQFHLYYGPILAEMGVQLVLIGTDATNFWETATPILTIVTFNAVIFWVALVLVLSLVVFLYLRNNAKIFSVSRALGDSKRLLLGRVCLSVVVLSLPAILLGGIWAWNVGIDAAVETLSPLVYLVEGIEAVTSLHISWLFVLLGVVAALVVLMAIGGAAFILGRPVLELLQGIYTRPKARKIAADDGMDKTQGFVMPANVSFAIPKGGFEKRRMALFGNITSWIFRHIIRQPVKTALGIAIALFFILSLGWLQESINRGQEAVDRLFDTTVVFVDLRNTFRQGGLMPVEVGRERIIDGNKPIRMVNQFRAQNFVENIYTESAHARAFVIHPTHDGQFPENWADIIGYDLYRPLGPNLPVLNFLYATNDFERFMFEHSRGFEDRFFDDLHIDFLDGYDGDIFAMGTEGGIVPIVVYQNTMTQRGFALGDYAMLVFANSRLLNYDMNTIPAKVVGTHNGQIMREGLTQATLLPTAFFDEMLGITGFFSAFNFTINPAYNREIDHIHEQLQALIPIGGFFRPITLFFLDEELRNAVVAMEQSILVLELLYPVAVALCIAIGMGLAILLMLQNDKNAAILRVLGASKRKTQAILCIGQLIICAAGIIAGTAFILLIGWGFGITATLQIAALYLGGTIIGLLIGATKTANKAPIDLLQVRE
ncbi:MAG: hypothetical protein FWB71_06135, partial [Defluviitaleaceae bacterium]|nr:hypothetical protein [Defluviitaleaceae bacterium]